MSVCRRRSDRHSWAVLVSSRGRQSCRPSGRQAKAPDFQPDRRQAEACLNRQRGQTRVFVTTEATAPLRSFENHASPVSYAVFELVRSVISWSDSSKGARATPRSVMMAVT